MEELKKIQNAITKLRIHVYAGISIGDNDKALYEIEQMVFKAMDELSELTKSIEDISTPKF